MNTSPQTNTGAFQLAGSLEIYQADTVRRQLLEFFASGTELVLDLGQIESCDAAGAQLLCSFRKTALQAGKSVRFENVSQSISKCWSGLGLSADFFPTSAPLWQK